MNIVFIIFDILRLILGYKLYDKFKKMQLENMIKNEIFFKCALIIIM